MVKPMSPPSTPQRGRRIEESTLGVASKKVRPVQIWAFVGALFILLQIYLYTAWILSDDFKRTPVGQTPVPGWMKFLLNIWQYGGLTAALLIIYFVVYRPWRRDGRLSLDGLICMGFLTVFWQNSLISWFQWSLTWNAYLINFGGWEPRVPGWLSPHANRTAEPFVTLPPMYIYFMYAAVVIGCFVMGQIRKRFPDLGNFGLCVVTTLIFFVFDACLEPLLMASGVWTYPGAIKGLTLFHGHYFQFPIYESILFGSCWAAWTFLRFFKDDKGRSVVERGADTLNVRESGRTLLRFLAIAGFLNLAMLIYSLLWAVIGLHSSEWPKDITDRSYLTNDLCGQGTGPTTDDPGYACPGPNVPVPRPGSSYITTDGTSFTPK